MFELTYTFFLTITVYIKQRHTVSWRSWCLACTVSSKPMNRTCLYVQSPYVKDPLRRWSALNTIKSYNGVENATKDCVHYDVIHAGCWKQKFGQEFVLSNCETCILFPQHHLLSPRLWKSVSIGIQPFVFLHQGRFNYGVIHFLSFINGIPSL